MKKVVKEAREIAGLENLKLYFTEEEVLKYDNEIRYNEGYKVGHDDGIQEGILQTKKEMVINMYNNGIALDAIVKISNLSIEEVNKIIDSIDNK